MFFQYSKALWSTCSVTPLRRWPATLETSRSRSASLITSRTRVPACPQSSSSGRNVYAVRTISPSVYQSASAVRDGFACGPPLELGAYTGSINGDDTHRAVLGVGVHRCLGGVDRDLLVVDPNPGAVGVGVGEGTSQKHFVRTEPGAGHLVAWGERGLFDLGVIVGVVAV